LLFELAARGCRHPKQRLAYREVSYDLGHRWVWIQRLPQADVVVLSVGHAGEEQGRLAIGEVVEVLDVMLV